MEAIFPLFFAAAVGFGHAFEADHLVAVGNIVTKRDKLTFAIKDGIYWGLGHTSTIFLIGMVMIVGKSTILNGSFGYIEAIVGLMLITLGIYRLYELFNDRNQSNGLIIPDKNHQLAFWVGLVHGLAGSGAMILLVMAEIQSTLNCMIYLLIFGVGSLLGMLVAAGIFSIPFSKRIAKNHSFKLGLVVLSSLLCIVYGGYVMFENLA